MFKYEMLITLIASHKSQFDERWADLARMWMLLHPLLGSNTAIVSLSNPPLLCWPPAHSPGRTSRQPPDWTLDCRHGKGGQLNSPAVQTAGPNININPHQDLHFPQSVDSIGSGNIHSRLHFAKTLCSWPSMFFSLFAFLTAGQAGGPGCSGPGGGPHHTHCHAHPATHAPPARSQHAKP